jgi:large subunit ribosomal protein L5
MAKKETKKQNESNTAKADNVMRKVVMEKMVLNCGGTAEKLDRSVKLLQLLSGKKVKEVVSQKRIPTFGVRPGLKTGCFVTLRGPEKEALLKRLFGAIGNKIKKKQIANNHFSFGIKEYLEIPDMEYQRDIGVIGLDVTVVFRRAGKRTGIKKIKSGRVPKSQDVSVDEIADYLRTKLNIEIVEPGKKGESEED